VSHELAAVASAPAEGPVYTGKDVDNMRHSDRLWLAATLALALAGCGDDEPRGENAVAARSPLVGHWRIDWDASQPLIERRKAEHLAKVPPEQRKVAEAQMKQALEQMKVAQSMDLHLEADGRFLFEFEGSPAGTQVAKGRWKKVGDALDLHATETNGKPVTDVAPPFAVRLVGELLQFSPDAQRPEHGFLLRKQ
jgi:hypothetical protein